MAIFTEKEGVRDISLRELLGKRFNFEVPKYQRGFCWDRKKEVSQFLDDIMYALEKQEEYFFGSMIFFKKPKEDTYVIIDGQQRTALVTILFIVIRDIYIELGEQLYAGQVNSEFIGKDIKKIENNYLSLANIDNKFFQEYILPINSEKEKKSSWNKLLKSYKEKREKVPTSNRLLYFAYDYLYENIHKKLNDKVKEDKIKFLRDIEEVVANKFKIINNVVKDEAWAYDVFETLNERGRQLGIRDLVKTCLFSKADINKENSKDVEIKWDKICKNLQYQSSMIDDFLRHYLMSIYGITRKKEVFKKFEDIIDKRSTILSFLTELEKESGRYASLLDPSKNLDSKKLIDLLEDINTLGVKLCYPLLLSGFEMKEFPELLEIVLKFTFRYSTVCGKPSNKLEHLYLDISQKIRKKELNIEEIKKIFKKNPPMDEEFLEEFENFEPDTNKIARYALREIEDARLMREILTNRDPDELNLEHIMPLNPDPDCLKHLESKNVKIDDWNKMLGNLTLLLKPVNEKVSNKCFPEKQKILISEYKEASKLSINKEIFSKETKDWADKQIIERQNKFVKIVKERGLWKMN